MKLDLRAARLNKGLSLDALSEQTGVPKTTLARVERGGAMPRPATALLIAEAFGLEPRDIWDFEEAAAA